MFAAEQLITMCVSLVLLISKDLQMLSDYVLEPCSVPAERAPSPGCSVTALRKDTAAPPRPLLVPGASQPWCRAGGALAGAGGSQGWLRAGGAAGCPSPGRSRWPGPAERWVAHVSGALAAGPEVSTQHLRAVDALTPCSPPPCRPARSPASPGGLKGDSRGTPGHAGASFS